MKLIVQCPHCGAKNKVAHSINTKVDYAHKYGEQFWFRCKHCGNINEYHVDDIRAVHFSLGELFLKGLLVSALVFIAALVAGIFLIGLAGAITGGIILVLVVLLWSRWKDASRKKRFNQKTFKKFGL